MWRSLVASVTPTRRCGARLDFAFAARFPNLFGALAVQIECGRLTTATRWGNAGAAGWLEQREQPIRVGGELLGRLTAQPVGQLGRQLLRARDLESLLVGA